MATKNNNDMTLERTLWETAESMRVKGNQEASEYKHVVLGLVFLKYVSGKFSERRQELTWELMDDGIEDDQIPSFLEDRDEMLGEFIDLICSIGFGADADHGADDILAVSTSTSSACSPTQRKARMVASSTRRAAWHTRRTNVSKPCSSSSNKPNI